jgi:predicted helicase
MRDKNISDQEYAEKYELTNNRDWYLDKARQLLRSDAAWQSKIMQCLYRPFDKRYCYFSEVAMDYPRRELVDHVAGKDNICIGLGRQGIAVNDPLWALISVSKEPIDANIFRRGGINVFPLYKYPDTRASLFDLNEPSNAPGGRHPNLSPAFIINVSNKITMQFITDGTN